MCAFTKPRQQHWGNDVLLSTYVCLTNNFIGFYTNHKNTINIIQLYCNVINAITVNVYYIYDVLRICVKQYVLIIIKHVNSLTDNVIWISKHH